MFTESKSLLRVWGVPYKKKNLWLCRGEELLLKKILLGEKKNPTAKKKETFSEPKQKAKKELSFPFEIVSSVPNKTKSKKKSIFFHFSFKTQHLKPTRFKDLNFQAKNTIKTVNTL